MTKTGYQKFTFGAQNENEIVFVPGKSGKITDYMDKIRIFIRVIRG